MGGQPKSKASSLSSAEVGRLWEEPTEETGPKPGSVAILAFKGEEDVKEPFRHWLNCRESGARERHLRGTGVLLV